MKRKYARFRAILLLVVLVSVPVLVHLMVGQGMLYSRPYYSVMFERHDIGPVYNESPQELNEQVLSYLGGVNESLPGQMTEREESHMSDVRRLVQAGGFIVVFLLMLDISLVIFSYRLATHKRAYLHHLLKWCGLGTAGLAVFLLALGAFFNFVFSLFHHIFFAEGSWIFPKGSLLVTLYPEVFFFESFMILVGGSFLIGLCMLCIGYLLMPGKMFSPNLSRGKNDA